MQALIDIPFEQLVKLVRQLPARQWIRLKEEVEQKPVSTSNLEAFLLSAPTFSEEQLDEIATTRKAMNQWRTK